jgi:Tfp pilus assembly protein PilN
MIPTAVRLGLVLSADRMIAAALHRGRLDTFIIEAEQPSDALRGELSARNLPSRGVAVGLPRSAVTVKPVELPEIGELGDMVRFELERHLPFAADEAPFDFLPMPADPSVPSTPGRRVLVTAADKRTVDTAIRLVQEAGLRPTSITVASHDLLALVHAPRGRRIAWVHRVGDDAELLLLIGPALALSRHVPGADDDAVASEIRRSLGVVKWRAVDEVWVSGDVLSPQTAAMSTLGELTAIVTEPPYTARVRRLLGAVDTDLRGARQLAAAVALGRRARPFDLIPTSLRARRFTRPQIVTAGMAAAAVILAIAALVVPGYRDRNRLAVLNGEIARLAPEMRTVERLQKDVERKRGLLKTLESLDSESIKPLPVLRELTDLLPQDAWLTLLSLDAKGAELTGQAAAASTLIPLLENSPRFERVEFASPVTRGRDKEQFRIIARWEGGTPRGVITTAAGPAEPAPPAAAVVPGPRTPQAARPPARAVQPPVAPTTDPDAPGATDPSVQPRRPAVMPAPAEPRR